MRRLKKSWLQQVIRFEIYRDVKLKRWMMSKIEVLQPYVICDGNKSYDAWCVINVYPIPRIKRSPQPFCLAHTLSFSSLVVMLEQGRYTPIHITYWYAVSLRLARKPLLYPLQPMRQILNATVYIERYKSHYVLLLPPSRYEHEFIL